jgi:hypothetical protein
MFPSGCCRFCGTVKYPQANFGPRSSTGAAGYIGFGHGADAYDVGELTDDAVAAVLGEALPEVAFGLAPGPAEQAVRTTAIEADAVRVTNLERRTLDRADVRERIPDRIILDGTPCWARCGAPTVTCPPVGPGGHSMMPAG